MRQTQKGSESMTLATWKVKMMLLAISQARLLCEMSLLEDKKIEPEQLRKNIATIQSVLADTLDTLESVLCSGSDNSISE